MSEYPMMTAAEMRVEVEIDAMNATDRVEIEDEGPPRGECVSCDEPAWRGAAVSQCAECDGFVCPCCVRRDEGNGCSVCVRCGEAITGRLDDERVCNSLHRAMGRQQRGGLVASVKLAACGDLGVDPHQLQEWIDSKSDDWLADNLLSGGLD